MDRERRLVGLDVALRNTGLRLQGGNGLGGLFPFFQGVDPPGTGGSGSLCILDSVSLGAIQIPRPIRHALLAGPCLLVVERG